MRPKKGGLKEDLRCPLDLIMARIAGVDLPAEKRIDAALPYLYGVGRSLARAIISEVGIDGAKRTKDLTEEEVSLLQKAVENYKVEGDLHREVTQNIKRLEEIGAYRGLRHKKGLPVRGQRTRSNSRTKRGRRMTVGTVRKDMVAKTSAPSS